MMAFTKDRIIFCIGIIFLIFGIGAIVNHLYFEQNTASILWLCYISMILLGIGVLRKDSSLVLSQITLLFIPMLFWNFDFFWHIFTSHSIFGITDYFFISGPLFGKIISLQHIFTIPLALYSVSLIGFKKKEFWKISVIQVFILFFASRIFTTPLQNVNCVYHNCAAFDFGLWYPLQWFLAYGVMIAFVNWVLVKAFERR